MAVVIREVPVFLICTQSVPLFDEIECTELAVVRSFYLPNLAQNFRNLGQVVHDLYFGRCNVSDEILVVCN